MDQCIHLWRYTGGFEKIDDAYRILEKDKVFTFTLLSNHNHNRRFFKLSFFSDFRTTKHLKRNKVYCCVHAIYNICFNSAIGHKSQCVIHLIFMKCDHIVLNQVHYLLTFLYYSAFHIHFSLH